MTDNEFEKQIIRSKFEILKSISDRFVYYWEMSKVPGQNLDELDLRLRQFTMPPQNATHRAKSLSVTSQSQTRALETNVGWNADSAFTANLERSGTFDPPFPQLPHLPLTTATECCDVSGQTSSLAIPHELELHSPSILYSAQNQA